MAVIRISDPGPLCTVQDLGRYGFMRFGVPLSGALDHYGAKLANLLVGNDENMALLEATYSGPSFEVLEGGVLAITGAMAEVYVNSSRFYTWSSFVVQKGDLVRIRPYKAGLRCYVAISGGIDVPLVMKSRSTCLSGSFGGLEGRPLKKGDVLRTFNSKSCIAPGPLGTQYLPKYEAVVTLRVVMGPQDHFFHSEGFLAGEFKISPKSDRMGYRLEGPKVELKEGYSSSIISEPIVPGAIQITPDGMPLIVLQEQTVGGYAKIGTVIYPDLSPLAQARPGTLVRFQSVTLEEAFTLYREYCATLDLIRQKLLSRIR